MTHKKWYYRQNGTEIGPLSSNELKQLANDGKIRVNAQVRAEGTHSWVSVSRVKEIAPFCTDVEIVVDADALKNSKDDFPPAPPLPNRRSNPVADLPPPPIPKRTPSVTREREKPAPAMEAMKSKEVAAKKEKWIRIGGNDEPSKIGNFIKYVVSGVVAGVLLFNKSQLRNKDKNWDPFGPKSAHSTESSYQKRVSDHQKAVERMKNFPPPSSSK
jgi:hypothetical protein